MIEHWLRIIVCNRCGGYLEAYRRVDDAIAYVCTQLCLAIGTRGENDIRAVVREKLNALTRELNRILVKRWNTVAPWTGEFVDLLMEKPDKSRIAVRFEEKFHKSAREQSDKRQSAATNPHND